MSTANGNGRYFILNREGSEIRFPMLAPSDFVELTGELRQQRKIQKAVSLAGAGVRGDAAVKELDAIDARKIKFADLIEWVNTSEGRFHFVLQSIKKDTPDAGPADVDELIVDDSELMKVAAGVANLQLTAEEPNRPLAEGGSPPTENGNSTPT